MLQALHTIMIGMTFQDSIIASSMANYLKEYSDDFEVIDNRENFDDCESDVIDLNCDA